MLCRAVAFTVVIYAILYSTVDTLNVLTIGAAGFFTVIVHLFLPNLSFLRSNHRSVTYIIDEKNILYVIYLIVTFI